MDTPKAPKAPVLFTIVTESVGDPSTFLAVMPLCPDCHRIVKDDVGSLNDSIYHARCLPKVEG